jgi:hypothetical protein
MVLPFWLLFAKFFLLLIFYVLDVSHVALLIVNPFSPSQITDSSCRAILDVDSCSIHDCHLKALLGYGTRCRGIVDIVSMTGVFEVMGEV